MKFKLDENLGERGRIALESAGHDVETVASQDMTSALDTELFSVCKEEERSLVTLDLDFANPLRFPPEDSGVIAVLRLPKSPSASDLDELFRVLIEGVKGREILERNLWIVELGRIRIYQPNW